ncbi:metallo-dependent hydrolase [Synergistales bacterium]|nr:metallo-dependent hydrolase [Synergistales bacterium]
MYDLVIRDGTVVDPATHMCDKADIAIKDGRIVQIGALANASAEQTIDASNTFVTPGLIDFHLHLAPLAEIGVSGEPVCFASGVTTAVDCGSAGCATYGGHRAFLCGGKLRVKCFLHVCSAGLATGRYLENPDPVYYDKNKIKRCFTDYPNELLGLKIRQGAEIVGSLGLEPLKATIELAEEMNVPVMVHCSNPPCPMDEILRLLRSGDILTHAFQDRGSTILDESGRVSKEARLARKRGVIFDTANANIHFSFAVARAAIAEGFLPDTISTDLTIRSLYKRPAVFNMLHVLSKYYNMGLSLMEILERCTWKPAKLLGLEKEIGALAIGLRADIAILKEIDHPTEFGDRIGEILTGNHLLKAMMTVKDGDVVYRDIEF